MAGPNSLIGSLKPVILSQVPLPVLLSVAGRVPFPETTTLRAKVSLAQAVG